MLIELSETSICTDSFNLPYSPVPPCLFIMPFFHKCWCVSCSVQACSAILDFNESLCITSFQFPSSLILRGHLKLPLYSLPLLLNERETIPWTFTKTRYDIYISRYACSSRTRFDNIPEHNRHLMNSRGFSAERLWEQKKTKMR